MPELKTFGVDRLREFTRKRVEASTLRNVASEIGMSFSGLRTFLDGTAPHPRTVQKLTTWYSLVRNSAPTKEKRPPRMNRAEVDAAISRLASFLLEEASDERRVERFNETVARIAREGRVSRG